MPEGLKFQPPSCAQFAAGQLVPSGTEGNMAAVSAEGEGNRFIVIAVETNEPVPVTEPGKDCSKVAFDGGLVRGTVESVEVPKIDGTTTIGVHRVVQTTVNGKPRTGEVFNYSAHFGNYQVIVSANPLVLPDKPTVPVNTQRAGSADRRGECDPQVAPHISAGSAHVARPELDAHSRADGGIRLGNRVLPAALAASAHHQKVPMSLRQP